LSAPPFESRIQDVSQAAAAVSRVLADRHLERGTAIVALLIVLMENLKHIPQTDTILSDTFKVFNATCHVMSELVVENYNRFHAGSPDRPQ
jgi:hypothetical protein